MCLENSQQIDPFDGNNALLCLLKLWKGRGRVDSLFRELNLKRKRKLSGVEVEGCCKIPGNGEAVMYC
jgi:hypothetical protein